MALRSTCLRGNVGAVIVDERNISVGLGYNGSASGERHCLDYGCIMEDDHCQRSIHAEVNAIINASRTVRGCTMYVTREPCRECRKVLKAAGIERVLTPSEDDREPTGSAGEVGFR
jgi:dCMP deaminase